MPRSKPNILITGTPGVGKSTLCSLLSEKSDLKWIDVSKVAVSNNFVEESDDIYKCPILDEDKLLDYLEEQVSEGGCIIDYHSCDFFPKRWVDIVFVLRADNTTLYDRLVARGYSGKKLEDNLDCEIFQTILEEAKSSYDVEIVHELENSNLDQLNENVKRIRLWAEQWEK